MWADRLCPPPDCLPPNLVCLTFPPRSVCALNRGRLCWALPGACQLSTNSLLLPRGHWLVEVVLAAVSQFCPCGPVECVTLMGGGERSHRGGGVLTQLAGREHLVGAMPSAVETPRLGGA